MAASRDVDLSSRFQKISIPGQDESMAIIGNVPEPPGQTAPTAAAEALRPDSGAPGPIIPADHSADWIVESEHYNKLSGTHSQCHFSVLYNGYNLSNSQCLPAGISALSYSRLFPGHHASQWDRTDLYRILNQANSLYAQHLNGIAEADPGRAEQIRAKIVSNGYYLTGSEMKDNCLLFGVHFQVRKLGESYANKMRYSSRRDGSPRGLEYDLNDLFNRTAATATPTATPISGTSSEGSSGQLMATSTSNTTKGALFLSRSYCRLVWKSADGKYYIFDSHFYPPSTESIVIETTSVKLLYDYLCKLLVEQTAITSRNANIANRNTEYELVPFEVDGPISHLTPAEYFAEYPSALDAPQKVVCRRPQPGENADANSSTAAATPIAKIVRASDAQVGQLKPNAAADQSANVAANEEDTVPPVPVPIEQIPPVQPEADLANPEQQSVSMEVDVKPAEVAASEIVAADAVIEPASDDQVGQLNPNAAADQNANVAANEEDTVPPLPVPMEVVVVEVLEVDAAEVVASEVVEVDEAEIVAVEIVTVKVVETRAVISASTEPASGAQVGQVNPNVAVDQNANVAANEEDTVPPVPVPIEQIPPVQPEADLADPEQQSVSMEVDVKPAQVAAAEVVAVDAAEVVATDAVIEPASGAQVGQVNPNVAVDQNTNVAANEEDMVPPVPVPIEQLLPVQPNAEQANPDQQSMPMEVDVEPAEVAAVEVAAADAVIEPVSGAQVVQGNPNAAVDQNANVAENEEDTVPLPVLVPIEQFLPVQPDAEQANPGQQPVPMEVVVEPVDAAAAEVVAADAAAAEVVAVDAAAAVAAQPNTSWSVVAIFEAQEDTNGVWRYLCQWGGGVYQLDWIAEEKLQESAALLLNLYKDHSGRFEDAFFANNDGGCFDQRTADILSALDDAGERILCRKVSALKTKLDSMDGNAEEYGNSVMMFMRLFFECEQLLNALAMKKAATSKREETNWKKGCDGHFGEVDYRRHINWALGELNRNLLG